ncbi:hypothetical protein GCM10027203_27890 [Nonomuraea fastidiosa]
MGGGGAVEGSGDAEADQPGPVLGQEYVGGFEVAVHDPAHVHGGRPLGQSGPEYGHGLQGERASAGDGLVQGGAGT